MAHAIRDLIADNPKLITVKPDDSVQRTLHLLAEHDFSQIPVVDDDENPIGMITGDSILSAVSDFGLSVDALVVGQAMTTRFAKVDPDDELFDVLDDMARTYAALVVDGSGKARGIVTHFDTVTYFRGQSEAFMLLEEIELQLREHARAAFGHDDDALQSVQHRGRIKPDQHWPI